MTYSMSCALSILKRFLRKHHIATLCLCVATVAGAKTAFGAESWTRESSAGSEATEMHLPADQPLTPWFHDPAIFGKDEGDRTEMR